jgi:serine/threonine protein kinase
VALPFSVQRIGKGTYGKVYHCVHRRTGYEVAIKALNKKKIAAQKMTEKVRNFAALVKS